MDGKMFALCWYPWTCMSPVGSVNLICSSAARGWLIFLSHSNGSHGKDWSLMVLSGHKWAAVAALLRLRLTI